MRGTGSRQDYQPCSSPCLHTHAPSASAPLGASRFRVLWPLPVSVVPRSRSLLLVSCVCVCVFARAYVCACGQLKRALEANEQARADEANEQALAANQTPSPPLADAHQHEPGCYAVAGGPRGQETGWWGEEERWTGVLHGETGLLRSSPLCRLAAMNAVGEGEECVRAGGKRVRIGNGNACHSADLALVHNLNALSLDLLRLTLAGLCPDCPHLPALLAACLALGCAPCPMPCLHAPRSSYPHSTCASVSRRVFALLVCETCWVRAHTLDVDTAVGAGD